MKVRSVLLAAASALAACMASAQARTPPQPAPPSPAIPAPADIPYPGVIRLAADATDLAHAIITVHETVPVQGAGPLTLLLPKWTPGDHRPTGVIDKLAGLVITADGRRIEWRRDPVDVFAFHVEVPAGVSNLDLKFQYLSPVSTREGRVMMTPAMLNVEWNHVTLYPAGYFARRIMVEPSIRLPAGFTAATALETAAQTGDVTTFKPVDFESLVDSPLIAGRNFRRYDLDPGGPARVSLDVIADRPDQLAATPEQLAAHRALVQQAYKLFASRHYDHYDFLLWLSDQMGGEGLEHQQSSEDGAVPRYFTDWRELAPTRDLLPHEMVHSWNGKFRRPADLWTPNLDLPMRGSLLWVYEGQTQYWGYVLAARSGLWSRQDGLDAIALVAATYDDRPGRNWRDLEDATNEPVISMRRPQSWLSWQRSEDYYAEGLLIWLDADTLIRQLSAGKRSLDDFAKTFFGVENGSQVIDLYDFDDIVAALDAVQPYDWAGFLHQRLDSHGPGAPLDGVGRGGYRLVYTDAETDFLRQASSVRRVTDLSFSIGLVLNRDGGVSQVIWDGPAFKAGLTEGSQVVAVNGRVYDSGELKDAIRQAKGAAAPIELLVKNKDEYRTVRVDYHDGLRYPRLERIADTPARLDDILAPRK